MGGQTTVNWAVIPAAGLGTRMAKNAVLGCKELIEVGGESMLERTIQEIENAGIENIVVVSSPNKPAIDAALASNMPVWLGLSCGDESEDGDLLAFENSKMKFSESLKTIDENFDAVLLMHSETKNTTKGLEEIKQKWNGHLGAYPHKGDYIRPNWQFDKTYTPEKYLNDMNIWVDQGVKIIGSCCGMGPEYTVALKNHFF